MSGCPAVERSIEIAVISPNTSSTSSPAEAQVDPAPSNTVAGDETSRSLCGGTPLPLVIPTDAAYFNREFGFTVYSTDNSITTTQGLRGGLLGEIVSAVFVDEDGLWIGYGNLGDGQRRGASHISNPLDAGSVNPSSRIWEACATVNGNRIGQHVNTIVKDANDNLWVATDGDGVWRLQGGSWEQFVFDQVTDNPGLPSMATFTLVPQDDDILVGTLNGVVRFNGLNWSELPSLAERKGVHAIAFAPNGDTWVGFIESGLRHVLSDGSFQDYRADNSGLSDNDVRDIVIDDEGAVWVATLGGGISVFDNGTWTTYRAATGALPSDNVSVLVKDKYGRMWAGTEGGATYFDGTKWSIYNNFNTLAIGMGESTPEGCSDAVDVWVGTAGAGLTHSRSPALSPVITDFKVGGIPEVIEPGAEFAPVITVTLAADYQLTGGDFLQVADQSQYTQVPLIGVPLNEVIKGGESYTFKFEENPFKAPEEPGHYQSIWRLWQCTRYVGPPISIEFDVHSP
jgi:hypothetical protein